VDNIILKPIGIVFSPYKEPVNVPIQPKYADGSKAYIKIFNDYLEGIKDLDLFSHIIILFHLNKATDKLKLKVVPFLDDVERGVFATRAPRRPNHIGLSVVKIERIENKIIYIDNCDILDQTPVVDIKPYNPEFDIFEDATTGWYEKEKVKNKKKKSDQRFS
jgi:tRNA (adenine37-N6)-methyltransferase